LPINQILQQDVERNLSYILKTQTVNGLWVAELNLLNILKSSEQELLATIPIMLRGLPRSADIWISINILAYLQKFCMQVKHIWYQHYLRGEEYLKNIGVNPYDFLIKI
jgi:hypothetical protein